MNTNPPAISRSSKYVSEKKKKMCYVKFITVKRRPSLGTLSFSDSIISPHIHHFPKIRITISFHLRISVAFFCTQFQEKRQFQSVLRARTLCSATRRPPTYSQGRRTVTTPRDGDVHRRNWLRLKYSPHVLTPTPNASTILCHTPLQKRREVAVLSLASGLIQIRTVQVMSGV